MPELHLTQKPSPWRFSKIVLISDQSDLIKPINDLLYDKELSKKLIHNGQTYVEQFLVNPGNASKSLADTLNSL